jgi:hypothetical protein
VSRVSDSVLVRAIGLTKVYPARGDVPGFRAVDGIGFELRRAIYQIARGALYHKAFHDITTGNNTATYNGVTITGYQARPGWDPLTGWGTPDAQILIPCSPAKPPAARKVPPLADTGHCHPRRAAAAATPRTGRWPCRP